MNTLLAMFCVVAATLLSATTTRASSINYGTFPVPGSGIMFQNVTESSGTDAVPLYGPPSPFLIGLNFNPMSFVATATGGAADITDGQLDFGAMGVVNANGGVAIDSLSLSERGDYTMVGVGTPATQVNAGAIILAKVLEVDGVPLGIPLPLPASNASVGFNLIANPGIVQPWSLGTGISINAALTGAGIPFTIGATKVQFAINNSLIAISEPGSVAFIAKKDFEIHLNTTVVGNPGIPEPGSLLLAATAIVGAPLLRCRSRQPSWAGAKT